MTFFASWDFYTLLLILTVPAILMGLFEKRMKGYWLLASLVMMAFIYGPEQLECLSLLLYFVYELGLVQLFFAIRRRFAVPAPLYRMIVALALLPLIVVKLPLSAVPVVGAFGFLGISYMTFRVVQLIVDGYDGTIQSISVFDFALFLLFFPTLSSGPIDRSRRFLTEAGVRVDCRSYFDAFGRGLWKILLGLVYKFTCAAFCSAQLARLADDRSVWGLTLYAYCYGLYLFFDFAGYSLLAVGTAYLFGVRVPDNFRYPFISRDMREFWDRWHITLSHWLRDYVFTRFIFQATRRKWFHTRLTRASIGFLLNMLLMGAWHGLTIHYLAYGLYHGLWLAATEIYQKKSSFYKKHRDQIWYQGISWLVTMQLVMFGFLIFSGHLIRI